MINMRALPPSRAALQREAMIPYTFPDFGVVLSYAMNNRRDAIYHLSALPRIAPWLFQYWRNAIRERVEQLMQALAPLMAQCVKEHDALIPEVGGAAQSLVNHRGWPRRAAGREWRHLRSRQSNRV
jgi:D-amino-acid dehydrogenase